MEQGLGSVVSYLQNYVQPYIILKTSLQVLTSLKLRLKTGYIQMA